MKKNAFTLIELLAVIVILAIVVLIATPIILGIIKDTKNEANQRSVELYADSIKKALLNYQLKENKKTIIFEEIEKYIEYDGNVVCDTIQINEDGNIYLNGCNINNDNSMGYVYGEQHLARENVRAVTESKTGIVPIQDSNGNIVPGSEFKIKVSNDIKDEKGEIAEYTFFVLSNSEDGKYVNLIAEQNITLDGKFTSEPQDKDEWYVSKSNSNDNRYGPQTAYIYLSTSTNDWTNIPMIEKFYYEDEGYTEGISGYQSIATELDNSMGKYITTITPYSSDYGEPVIHKNMRARLPYESEIIKNTGCRDYITALDYGSCPLWMVNYLSSSDYYISDKKVNSFGDNYGYWVLSSYSNSSGYAKGILYSGRLYVITSKINNGIRPVITILKSDLFRVMKKQN